MRREPRFLMCPPEYYGIEYEINPWMRRQVASVRDRALEQWEGLRRILEGLGAVIERIDPVPRLPDLVFTANAGLVSGDLFVTSRFRHPERQGETPYFERWFADHGFRIVGLATTAAFEGAGDALFCGDILFAGYLVRSEIRAQRLLGVALNRRILSLELVDPRFYHLDTCFCPLAPGCALYFPGAFDDYGRRVLATHIPKLLEVSEADADAFGCNAVVLDRHVVLHSGASGMADLLEPEGFRVHPTDLSEFLKAGGSAKCLTLRLDGEEAVG